MTQDSQIRRNPDGSIDMSYYLGKGRDCRSRAALRFVARPRLVLASHLTGGLRTSPPAIVLHQTAQTDKARAT